MMLLCQRSEQFLSWVDQATFPFLWLNLPASLLLHYIPNSSHTESMSSVAAIRAQIQSIPLPTTSFAGQTIIVTGSNTDLGLEAAWYFVRLDATRVILAVRRASLTLVSAMFSARRTNRVPFACLSNVRTRNDANWCRGWSERKVICHFILVVC